MACDGPMDPMGWVGGDGVTQGGDVMCQHVFYTNNVKGYGWPGDRLWSGGVLLTSWMCS